VAQRLLFLGEKVISATNVIHGVWTHFLLEAMSGHTERCVSITSTSTRELTANRRHPSQHKKVCGYLANELRVRIGTMAPHSAP